MTDSHRTARKWHRAGLVAILLAGTALGGFVVGIPAGAAVTADQGGQSNNAVNSNSATPAPEVTESHPPINKNAGMAQRLPDFTQLVKQVKPAVVSVTNYLQNNAEVASDELQQSPQMPQLPFPFNQFPFNQMPHEGGGGAHHAVEARGSGFIINPDGLIVTNNHVVKDARRLTVTLDDGQTLQAKVVGTDPRTDIAVLKVDAKHSLPYLQLGNSGNVEPGEWVIAIGNPFGLSETVTAGIVSALGRSIGAGPYDQFIQIDAPINQGNSGGPLITQDGKVVGMNSAILSPSGGSIGIGFAIPSNLIKRIATDLQQSGHVTRGYLGVEAQPVTPAIANALNLSEKSGALVAAVEPNTPAQKAGLQPGDVIRSVNGQEIKTPAGLAQNIAGIKPGDEAHLNVLRNGHQESIDVHVAELPSEEQMAGLGPNGSGQHSHEPHVGLALAPLSPDLAQQMNLPDGTKGALVTKVQPGSPAEQAGLQAGDVVVGVGSEAVNGPGEATKAIRKALQHDHNALALRVLRDGQPVFVAIEMNNQNEKGQTGNG